MAGCIQDKIASIGQDKQYQNPRDALVEADGMTTPADDPTIAAAEDERVPLRQLPQARDPSPFKLGPLGG